MNLSWLRSSRSHGARTLPLTLALTLSLAGCFPDFSGLDLAIDGLFVCSWKGGTSFPVTEGTGDVHATLFAEASPEVVARGAVVSAVLVVPGAARGAAATGEGEVAVATSEAQVCEPSDTSGGEGGAWEGTGGAGGAGGDASGGRASWSEPGERTTQITVALTASGAGSVAVMDRGALLARWTLDVRDAVSLESADGDQPTLCFVGEECVVRGRVLDADGVELYADESYTWSVLEGDVEVRPFFGSLRSSPEQPGTFRVRAEVLGLSRDFDVEVQ